MTSNIYAVSGKFKLFLMTVVIFFVLGLLAYTQWLVRNLREDSRKVVSMWATIYEKIASDENMQQSDGLTNFLFEEVIQKIYFPAIMSDAERTPLFCRNLVNIPDGMIDPADMERAKQLMQRMAVENEPINIYAEGFNFGYIYYGDSRLITHLQRLPYVEIGVAGLFALIGLLGFNIIRRSEQRFIWVGMAKETAHQLGTPISSLMGWLGLLEEAKTAREMKRTVSEMGKDLKRLEKVAARFSQIGSKSDLKDQELVPILKEVVTYIRRRLPQMEQTTKIVEQYPISPKIALNRDLFEWALENLIKNSLDAVKGKNGLVRINLSANEKGKGYYIDVVDNGCGIEPKHKKTIFKPGYSTKKRGWGLGLNLSKRIIEEYHKGKLFLKESKMDEGTTMRIILY